MISISVCRNDDVVGFGAFNITKNFEEPVSASGQNLFTAECTLLLRVFLADDDHAATELFKTIFTLIPTLHYILIYQIDPKLSEICKPTEHESFRCVTRDQFVPVLFVREAKVEDNDDISLIYQAESKQLKQFYGDFFFTELVESADANHKVLVADYNDTPVGAMSVTSNISIDLLRKTHNIGHLRYIIFCLTV